MPQGTRPRASRTARLCLALGALLMAAVLASPVAADDDQGRLDHPAVAPEQGTSATPFVFTVRYRASDHLEAAVRVNVAGSWRAMRPTGTDWGSGVIFTMTTTLPAGTFPVSFDARSGGELIDEVPGPTLVVTPGTPAPTPTPRPTPAPTATPKPVATPSPTPKPTPAPTPTPAAPAGSATATPGASPSDQPGTTNQPAATSPVGGSAGLATGTPGASGEPTPGRSVDPTSTPGTASPEPSASSPETEPGAAVGNTGGGPADPGDPGGWGNPLGALTALGLSSGSPVPLSLPQAFVVSAGATTMAMAFMLFGKRRRDGEPTAPDEVLEAAAAGASEAPVDASLADAAPPVDLDALMPRWRRPSLLQARKSDPVRDAVPIVPMSFGDAPEAAGAGVERRLVRYHVVELLDAPDELRSRPVATLTRGDEVQLLERSGTYCRILCPDGQQGWVHRMTLGAPVGAEEPSALQAWAIPADSMARATPASQPETEQEGDLFASFLAARRADA